MLFSSSVFIFIFLPIFLAVFFVKNRLLQKVGVLILHLSSSRTPNSAGDIAI